MATRPTAKENAKRFASVIQMLQACEAAYAHYTTGFGKSGHAEAMARCIGVCMDYAEYYALTHKLLEHNSEFAELLLEDYAEIYSQCAEECDHHGQGHCSVCTTACRICLGVCLKVAGVKAITAKPTVF